MKKSKRKSTLRLGDSFIEQAKEGTRKKPANSTTQQVANDAWQKYHIIKEIGQGGMGKVYLAYDRELSRSLVLKCILENNPKNVQRLQREAQASSSLDHPNIIKTYGVFLERGIPCIAMEYIKGETLADFIEGKKLSRNEALAILSTIAKALDYAHRQGIIHRDIKPSNIMLNENKHPYLMDFGLAKYTSVPDKTLTKSGEIIGTPRYMSPEQASGKSRTLDGRTDVYALGVILYEIITERQLFPEATGMQLLYSIIEEQPILPRKIQANVPKALEQICLKAIEKKAKMRYQTPIEIAQDIDNFLAGKKIKSLGWMHYAQKLISKKIWIPVLVPVVAILLFPMLFSDKSKFLSEQYAYEALELYKKENYVESVQRYNDILQEFSKQKSSVDRQKWAQHLYQRGLAYYHLKKITEALNDFDAALKKNLEPTNSLYKEILEAKANIYREQAHEYGKIGQHIPAIHYHLQAVEANYLLQRFTLALEHLNDALNCGEPQQIETGLRSEILFHKYVILNNQEELGKSLKTCQELMELCEDLLFLRKIPDNYTKNNFPQQASEYTKQLALLCYLKAQIHYEKKQYLAAIKQLNHATSLNPDFDEARFLRVQIYCDYDHPQMYKRAISDCEILITKEKSEFYAWHALAIGGASRQHRDKAFAHFDKALQIDPNCVHAYVNRGIFYFLDVKNTRSSEKLQGRTKAIREFTKAIEKDSKNFRAYSWRGWIYSLPLHSEHSKALQDFQSALKYNPDDEITISRLAILYQNSKKHSEALKLVNKAIDKFPSSGYLHYYKARILYLEETSKRFIDLSPCIVEFSEALRVDPYFLTTKVHVKGILDDLELGKYNDDIAIKNDRKFLEEIPRYKKQLQEILKENDQKLKELGFTVE